MEKVFEWGVKINKQKRENQRQILSRHDFFSQRVCVKIDEDKISFTHVDIDYMGRIYSPVRLPKSGIYYITIIGELPYGTFNFDEDESNEDKLVVYFKEDEC